MNSQNNSSPQDLPSLSSSSLLDRVQQMRPDAWARMVDVFSPIVYRWARKSGLNGDDSADVVQDVFIAVARNIGTFQRQKQSASFRSWLATITRNRVKDCFRKRQRDPGGFGGTEALRQFQNVPDEYSMSDDELEQSISLATLDRRLPIRVLEIVKSECDPKTWQAFWQTTVMHDSAPMLRTDWECPWEMSIRQNQEYLQDCVDGLKSCLKYRLKRAMKTWRNCLS